MRDLYPESKRIDGLFKSLTKEQRRQAVKMVGVMFPEVQAKVRAEVLDLAFKRREA